MNRNEILDRLQPIFQDLFDNPDLVVTEASSALDIPDWDSLAQVNLVLGAEREFNVRFDSDRINDLANVGELISEIQTLAS